MRKWTCQGWSGIWFRHLVSLFFSAWVGKLTNYIIRHMSKYSKYDIIAGQPFLEKMYKHHKPTFWVLAPTQHMSDGTNMLKLSFCSIYHAKHTPILSCNLFVCILPPHLRLALLFPHINIGSTQQLSSALAILTLAVWGDWSENWLCLNQIVQAWAHHQSNHDLSSP